MGLEGRMKKRPHFWLDFVSCVLIPGYTLLFAGSVQWFSSNFSVIAVTGADHYRGFVYWGILAGGYFLVMLGRLAGRLPRRGAQIGVLLITVCAIFSLGMPSPFPISPPIFRNTPPSMCCWRRWPACCSCWRCWSFF